MRLKQPILKTKKREEILNIETYEHPWDAPLFKSPIIIKKDYSISVPTPSPDFSIENIGLLDIYKSYKRCQHNKNRKTCSIEYEIDELFRIFNLYKQLNDGSYQVSPSTCFCVTQPVIREVFAASFDDRVVHHIIMDTLIPIMENLFIDDSYSCRNKKGSLYGIQRISDKMRSVNYEGKIIKGDLKGFFMSIDKPKLYNGLKRLINKSNISNKEWFLWLIYKVVFDCPQFNCIMKQCWLKWKDLPKDKSLFYKSENTGIPIGNLTSQWFANFFLDLLDKYVTKTLRLELYGRYVDDFVIIVPDDYPLKPSQIISKIRNFLSSLGLILHPHKIYIQPCNKGCQFIGGYLKIDRKYVCKRVVSSFSNKLFIFSKYIETHEPDHEELKYILSSMNSYLGLMKQFDSFNIRKKIIWNKKFRIIHKYFTIDKDLSKFKIKEIDMESKGKIHIFIKTNNPDELFVLRYQKLVEDLKGIEITALIDVTTPVDIPKEIINYKTFTADELLKMCKDNRYYEKAHNTIGKRAICLSLCPVLLYSDAEYTWMVEDDVIFSGSWKLFFDEFKDSTADFISSYIRYINDDSAWEWKEPIEGINGKICASLNCVCRLSKRLAESLKNAYMNGLYGHYEACVISHCVEKFGFESVEDIIDKKKFYEYDLKDESSTYVWHAINPDKIYAPNKLFHSVKYPTIFDNLKVSVVIPVYNASKYIERCVNSIKRQTYRNIEIIIVDDCSTDNSKEIIKKLNITKFLEHHENKGAGISRREGISRAIGYYVLLLDADDCLSNNFIKDLIIHNESADIISGGITIHQLNGDIIKTLPPMHVEIGPSKIINNFMKRIMYLNNKLVRRSLYDKVLYSDSRLIEDTETLIKLLYYSNKLKYIENPGYHYIQSTNSLTQNASQLKTDLFRFICIVRLIDFFKDKEQIYQNIFNKSILINISSRISIHPLEEIKQLINDYPNEWNIYSNYLRFLTQQL